MTKTINTLLSIFSIIILNSIGFGQSNEIKIRYIGNCGLHITDGVNHILTDFPYKSGAHNYAEYDDSEIDSLKENSFYIFTHKHSDHYSNKLLKNVIKTKNGKAFGPWNISELEKLGKIIPNFEIIAFKTKHTFSLNHYSYLITWHNKKIFLSGDTKDVDIIGKMTNLDWAFVPSWLVIEINENDLKIDSKMIGIYHIGPKDDIDITGEKVLMLKKQGEVISIPF
jgi:hypothetical protein